MRSASHLDDTLDAVIDRTANTIATLLGLPCPDDPGNRLRLLALIQIATNRALTQTIAQAQRHDYAPDEIADLLDRPHAF